MNSIADLGFKSKWPTLILPALQACALSLLLLPLAARADGVVTNATEANLRAAMAGGGTVTFACDGTITLASTITNLQDTVLDATGHQIIISGGNSVRVFLVNTNTHFTLSNLSVANGYSQYGSAILNLRGTVNLQNVAFSGNAAFPNYFGGSSNQFIPSGGGAIFNDGGTVTAGNCSFVNNSSSTSEQFITLTLHFSASGGAIYNQGLMSLAGCTFTGNSAAGGSSIVQSMYGQGDPGYGGAIYNNTGTLTLDLCNLTGNSASGGASFGDPTGLPGPPASGGAIYNVGPLTITRSTLSGNHVSGGSGGHGLNVSDPNNANGFPGGAGGSADGGAISSPGWISVTASTLSSNVVTGGSGGWGGNGRRSSPDTGGSGANGANGGYGLGGAVSTGGTAYFLNCTIAFNAGNGGSGGNGGGGWPSVTGSSGGSGGNGGTGGGGIAGTCNITNCTLAGNAGIGGAAGQSGSYYPPGTGGTNGVSGSAWGAINGSTLANALLASSTPPGGDTFPNPMLGPLANNGGPTLTMALLAGSPAIDAGTALPWLTMDQRGFPRPIGAAIDLGAYEYGSVMPTLSIYSAAGGSLTITAYGNSYAACRLWTSIDFSNWTAIATNQIGGDGSATFNYITPSDAQRFYRLSMP